MEKSVERPLGVKSSTQLMEKMAMSWGFTESDLKKQEGKKALGLGHGSRELCAALWN